METPKIIIHIANGSFRAVIANTTIEYVVIETDDDGIKDEPVMIYDNGTAAIESQLDLTTPIKYI